MPERVMGDPRTLNAGWQARPRVGDEKRGVKGKHPACAHITTTENAVASLKSRPNSHKKHNGTATERLNQRLKALDRANAVRIERGQIRRQLHGLELDFDEFLDAPPSCCADVPLMKILTWLPNIGKTVAQRIVSEMPMMADRGILVVELTPRAKYYVSERVRARVEFYARVWGGA